MANADKIFEDAGRKSIIYSAMLDYITGWFLKKFTIKQRIDFEEITASLLNNPTKENIQKSSALLFLHRHYENTKARRRLEKWSSRVISLYLFTVALLLVFNYSECKKLDIPDNIMIVILTTTTINIIGLVIIVLRGHFQNKNETKENELLSDIEETVDTPETPAS